MASKLPQPRVEGVNLSGTMAGWVGGLHHGQRRLASYRRSCYETAARESQRNIVRANQISSKVKEVYNG